RRRRSASSCSSSASRTRSGPRSASCRSGRKKPPETSPPAEAGAQLFPGLLANRGLLPAGCRPGGRHVEWRGGGGLLCYGALASDRQAIEHLEQRAALRFTTTGDQQREVLSEKALRGERGMDPDGRRRQYGILRMLRDT